MSASARKQTSNHSLDCPIFSRYQCASTCSNVHLALWTPDRILYYQYVRTRRLPSGGRGRRFESSHPDQIKPNRLIRSPPTTPLGQ